MSCYLYERELLEISKFHPNSLMFRSKKKSRRYSTRKLTSRRERGERIGSVDHSPENTPEPYTAMKFYMDDTLDARCIFELGHVYLFSLVQVNRIRQVHHKYRANDTLRIYLQPELGQGPNSVRATAPRM